MWQLTQTIDNKGVCQITITVFFSQHMTKTIDRGVFWITITVLFSWHMSKLAKLEEGKVSIDNADCVHVNV